MNHVLLAAVLTAAAGSLLLAHGVLPTTPPRPLSWSASHRLVLLLVPAAALSATTLGPRRFGYVAAVGLLVLAVRRLVRDARCRRDRRATRTAVIAWCDALVAELAAGQPAQRAVVLASSAQSRWSSVGATAGMSGDVGHALRSSSAAPGAGGLRAVAAAWDVSSRSGAVFADVVEGVAAGLRDDQEAAEEIVAAVAPARATARLLAVLPVFGIVLGASMGADPMGFLLGSSAGLVCLSAGVALAVLGVFWVEHLVDRAELS